MNCDRGEENSRYATIHTQEAPPRCDWIERAERTAGGERQIAESQMLCGLPRVGVLQPSRAERPPKIRFTLLQNLHHNEGHSCETGAREN